MVCVKTTKILASSKKDASFASLSCDSVLGGESDVERLDDSEGISKPMTM